MRYELADGELAGLRDHMVQEMRRNVAIRSVLVKYLEARVLDVLQQVGSPGLLNASESDMLRGRIAELKNIINEVQSTGEEAHGLE